MRRSPSPGSRPASPALLRKAASSPSFCFLPCSVSELLRSTQSSPLPRRLESVARFPVYDSMTTASESGSVLPFQVYCVPRWERATWSCSTQTEFPDEKGTQTEALTTSTSNDAPTSSENVEEAWQSMFSFRFLRGFKCGNTPLLLSLTALGVFIVALAAITTVTGTVNANKMENLELLPDVLEKEEAVDDVTSASADTQAPATATVRGPRRAWARTRKTAKTNKTASFPQRRTRAHGRTGTSGATRRPQYTAVSQLPTAEVSSAPPVTPRSSRTSRTAPAAGTIKRTGRKAVDSRLFTSPKDHLQEVTGKPPDGSLVGEHDDGATAAVMARYEGPSHSKRRQSSATTLRDIFVEEIL